MTIFTLGFRLFFYSAANKLEPTHYIPTTYIILPHTEDQEEETQEEDRRTGTRTHFEILIFASC